MARLLLAAQALFVAKALADFDCSFFATAEATIDGGLSQVRDYIAKSEEDGAVLAFEIE